MQIKIEINVNPKECEIKINEVGIDSNKSYLDNRTMMSLYVARKENNLKQRDIARLLNMHEVTYSRKERGELDFTLSEAFILADYFNTTVDVLFADRKQPLKK